MQASFIQSDPSNLQKTPAAVRVCYCRCLCFISHSTRLVPELQNLAVLKSETWTKATVILLFFVMRLREKRPHATLVSAEWGSVKLEKPLATGASLLLLLRYNSRIEKR